MANLGGAAPYWTSYTYTASGQRDTETRNTAVPEEGRTVRAGETICVVESTEATHEVYSPFSGEVIGTNVSLEAYDDWVNHSPYDRGWLFRIKPMDGAPLNLLAAAEYERLVG